MSSVVSSNGDGCQKKYATTQAAMISNVTTGRRETGLSSYRGSTAATVSGPDGQESSVRGNRPCAWPGAVVSFPPCQRTISSSVSSTRE
jgi:hypothetical protein